jgi:hypothetical protein
MVRKLSFPLAGLCLLSILATNIRAATPAQVDAAIQKAVEYLYKQQKNGNWEVVAVPDPNIQGAASNVKGFQWGGLSAMATCALRYAGESPQNPRMRQAIDWLTRADMYGVYGLGFRCQVWAMVPPSDLIRFAAQRDAAYLIDALIKKDAARGCFPYFSWRGKSEPGSSDADHSVSQYGVLGLWGCYQVNIEIPTAAWIEIESAWRSHQYPNGGWAYRFPPKPRFDAEKPLEPPSLEWARETLPMTAAGVTSLFITQEQLHAMEGLEGRGNITDPHLERGLRWISENFPKYKESGAYYTLYGMERIGVAAGYKYFGKINWYEDGAEFLVKQQHPDGSWGDGDANSHDNANKVPNTSFALMFLARGRAPVMMNKLAYTLAGSTPAQARMASWNQRPREVANITRWVGKQIERDLNWQIVGLQAPVEELLDAPILWISGKETLSFTSEEEAKLKQFVEMGGMILGHADNANRLFAQSFTKLSQKLFPYEFRELPSEHPIYTRQAFPRTTWKKPPGILGLSNGVRELMLLFPAADPARAWQIRSFGGVDREPLAQAMANIFLYAVDKKNLQNKGQTFLVKADDKIKAKQTLKVARLDYGAGWDPEPGGWRRLKSLMHNQHQTDLTVESVKLGSGRLDNSFAIAHLTGAGVLKLTAQQQTELEKYVQAGGTLVLDAAGGKDEFAASAADTLKAIFKSAELKPLPATHAVYSAGEKITEVGYRSYARAMRKASGASPRLQGLEVNGKVKVLFSAEDLSAGLVGQPVDGIAGYDPKSASALMANIILYAK